MSEAAKANESRVEVILDHTSPLGPTATHMRGTLLVNSIENLRALGLYNQYAQALPATHREPILYAIATSWVPIEVALAHYETCDQLGLDSVQLQRLGELSAQRISETFMSAVMRASRNAGVDNVWLALGHADRIWDRMYQGGGVRLLRTGPKDLVYETHGLPLVLSRYWRAAYVQYLSALGNLFTRVAFVKPVRPRVPHPHCIAIAGSWV